MPDNHIKVVVDKIEGPAGRIYTGLAKTGLWASAISLSAVVVRSVNGALAGDTAAIGNVIQACQVMSMIAITVLGYHGYKGTRIFHNLRHWNDGNDSVEK